MYKVLIIDDEVLIGKGLESKIDWKKLNCEVCSVATDGLEGKRLIDGLRPDIVISDIVMPGKTGLELAEYISLYHPNIITIILTAYDKFQYAQRAIKYGVKDYILKPIDKEQIIKAVKGAVAKLKQKEFLTQNVNNLETLVKEAKPIITNTVLFDVAINGSDQIDQIKDKLEYFNIDIGNGAIVIFRIDCANTYEINRLHYFVVKNSIQNAFVQHGCECAIKELDDQYIIIAKFNSTIAQAIIKKRLMEICHEIQNSIYDNIKLGISAGIGKYYHDIYGINNSYKSAVHAIDKRFFMDTSAVIYVDGIEEKQEQNYFFSDHEELYARVRSTEKEKAVAVLEKVMSNMRQVQNEKYIKGICINIIEQLNKLIIENSGDETQKLSIDNVKEASTFTELKNYVEECVKACCNLLNNKLENTNNNIVNRTLKIIHEGYSNKKLSLQWVADELNVSFSHLSRLFKKETNKNFMDYLTDLRINKAMELLKNTGLKNNEIADKVGFHDYRYFSQVFKKKCEMTPAEYRNKMSRSKI